MTVFRTALADVTPASGWRSLPALGVDVSAPLWDVRPPLEGIDYARLTYADALRLCAERDVALLSADALEAMLEGARVLRPVTLPAGDARMMGAEWAARHDEGVRAQLSDTAEHVVGIGKHWVAGAPPGRSWLMGWHVPDLAPWTFDPKTGRPTRRGPGWVQPRPAVGSRGAHDDQHVDYSMTTLVMRPTVRFGDVLDASAARAALSVARSLFLGDVEPESPGAAIVRVALSQVGVREATGKNDGAQIAKYFQGCTRRIKGIERPTGWVSGWDWCAAEASWVVHVALGLPVGAEVPVGRRISVRELVEDARACGRLETSRTYRPRPGDLWIGARGGGDPLVGGTGHVRITIEPGPTTYTGCGGNEGNAVTLATHRYDDPTWRAWVRTT